MAKPPLSRTARRIRKSPMACGTRMPEAIVCAFSQRGACSSPASKAFTIGAQPEACTRDHARTLLADEADGFELGECLPHTDQAGAATGRIEDDVGNLPAELLGKFEAHRLLTFDPVRLLQGRGVEPANLGLSLADDLAAIID